MFPTMQPIVKVCMWHKSNKVTLFIAGGPFGANEFAAEQIQVYG